MKENRYRIQLLDRVMAILDCFQGGQGQFGVTEISKQVGLHKSTVHRVLEALKSYRFVIQDPANEKYSLGPKFLELSRHAGPSFEVRERSKAILEQLVAETGETAHLCVLDQGEVLYVEKCESAKTLRIPSRVGHRNPSYCTAVGKALLAFLPHEIERLSNGTLLQRYTPNTITDFRKLRQELASIRERGYSIDNEEIEVGLRCVGAPVRDHSGIVIAAVSIAGPIFRMADEKIPSLAASVLKAAQTLSERMGYRSEALVSGVRGKGTNRHSTLPIATKTSAKSKTSKMEASRP